MKTILQHSRKGFTMIELMIVIAIIGILMGISALPYGEYISQARLSNNADSISQEWILSHKEVRNGLEYATDSHATIIFEFDEKENSIKKFLYKTEVDDGKIVANYINFPANAREDKKISLENNVEFFGKNFNGGTKNDEKFYYVITPPYGEGKFFSQNWETETQKHENIFIALRGADNENSPKVKKIFLRPYLQ